MTKSLLDGGLRTIINKAFSSTFLDAEITRVVRAEVQTDPLKPVPAVYQYSCKAIPEKYSSSLIRDGMVRTGEAKVLILAGSIKVLGTGEDVSAAVSPAPGDRIVIRGKAFIIVPPGSGGMPAVSTDPAQAVWECRCSA